MGEGTVETVVEREQTKLSSCMLFTVVFLNHCYMEVLGCSADRCVADQEKKSSHTHTHIHTASELMC